MVSRQMAKITKFRIDSDKQVARALLRQGTQTRAQLMGRAGKVRQEYNKMFRIESARQESGYKNPSSPFDQKQQQSILDRSAFSVKVVGDHIEIAITSPAAVYVEEGNEPGPPNDLMAIRIKPKAVKRKGRKLTLKSGAKVSKYKGKYYIFTTKVKPFKGYHLLQKAVNTAFRIR